MRGLWVAVLVACVPFSGCVMLGMEPEPISANEAYDLAQEVLQLNMERNGRDVAYLVGAVAVEGRVPDLGKQPAADDFHDRAVHDLGEHDGIDGALGDGVTRGWVLMFILAGNGGKNAASLLVPPRPDGVGAIIVGQDGRDADATEEPKVGPFNPCGETDVANWKVSSQEAARIAAKQPVMADLKASSPGGWYHYDLLMDEGFLDGCGGTPTPHWTVSYIVPQGDVSKVASVTLDATSGDIVEEGVFEQVLDAGRTILLDAQKTFTNPVPCDLGCGTAGDDPEVGNFTLDGEATDVWVNFTRTASGTAFFADNCRLWRGSGETDLVEQAAFSDAQYGQVGSTGTCNLHFDTLRAGFYRAVYGTDQLFPGGTHDVHVLATAEL